MPSREIEMINREDEHLSVRMEHHEFGEVSDKEDVGHNKTRKEIPKNPEDVPHKRDVLSKFHRAVLSKFHLWWWNKIFLVLCAMALVLDPLYCYIPSVNATNMCYYLDMNLVIAFVVLRSAMDLSYVIDSYIFARKILKNRNATTFWASWSWTKSEPIASGKPAMWDVACKLSFIVFPRIFLVIPIPQAIIFVGTYTNIGVPIPLLVFHPIQYALRSHRTYILLKENRPGIESDLGRWVRAISDFIPFFIAAHLFGAVWYYFSLDRQVDCWMRTCSENSQNTTYSEGSLYARCTSGYYFRCHYYDHYNHNFTNAGLTAKISKVCTRDTTDFNYGIYKYSLESGVTGMPFHPRKVFLCFWWGLRNLSSFGSDLKTSPDMIEATVSILVSISGMALFLVYLNARMQELQERKKQLKMSQKLKKMNPEINLWLSRRGLPKDMNQVIRERVRRELKDNKHVDVKNILAILPLQQRDIMYQFHLSTVKKVPRLGERHEDVLKAICRHLEPVTYPKNSYIIHAGEQLLNVLFITEGAVVSYTTRKNTDVGASTSTDGSSSGDQCLKKGDFYGEELVSWAFNFRSFGDLPVSRRTVMSKTKVEAFTISANDLATVASEFQISIRRKLPRPNHDQLKNLAASYIQEAWHRRRSQAS